jgi:hypothetical protein
MLPQNRKAQPRVESGLITQNRTKESIRPRMREKGLLFERQEGIFPLDGEQIFILTVLAG